MKGIERFRQAIKNQQDVGEGEFRLTYAEAKGLASEINQENIDVCNEFERMIAKYSWADGVPAPVDANGEVVPLTTEVMYDKEGEKHEVNFYSFAPGSGYWTVNINKQLDSANHVTEGFRLHRPDSWERVEEDIQKVTKTSDICGYFDKVGKTCNGCPALTIPGTCSAIVLRDVLRRAKALAEREAEEAER